MALANGYRISQQLSSQQRPGIVNLNGDGTYLGPIEKIPHYSEFQLIASWGSYEQMENNDLGFFLMDDALKLLKYYDKLSRKQDIPGSFERDAVRGKYDLDNARKRQLLISCGILITSFRNVERWRSFRALTQELTHYLYQFEGSENGNEVPFTMRNFPDIVIPFVMRWRWERIHDYAETRVRGRGYPEKDIRANAQARR